MDESGAVTPCRVFRQSTSWRHWRTTRALRVSQSTAATARHHRRRQSARRRRRNDGSRRSTSQQRRRNVGGQGRPAASRDVSSCGRSDGTRRRQRSADVRSTRQAVWTGRSYTPRARVVGSSSRSSQNCDRCTAARADVTRSSTHRRHSTGSNEVGAGIRSRSASRRECGASTATSCDDFRQHVITADSLLA